MNENKFHHKVLRYSLLGTGFVFLLLFGNVALNWDMIPIKVIQFLCSLFCLFNIVACIAIWRHNEKEPVEH